MYVWRCWREQLRSFWQRFVPRSAKKYMRLVVGWTLVGTGRRPGEGTHVERRIIGPAIRLDEEKCWGRGFQHRPGDLIQCHHRVPAGELERDGSRDDATPDLQ